MPIPSNILQAMAPIAFGELQDRLSGGDIVLCQGRDPFSKLIQWSTKSPWSHVGLVFRNDDLEQLIVVEAVENIGVRAVALADFVSRDSAGTHPYPGKILFVRHKQVSGDPSDPMKRMARFAFGRLGTKFAGGEVAKIAMRIIGARLFGDQKTPTILEADDELICSELVAGAYSEAGFPIPWDGLGFIAPADIANDPNLDPIAQADVRRPPIDFSRRRAGDRPMKPKKSMAR